MYITKMDNRTTKVCKWLTGEIVKVLDVMMGIYFNPNHINCRSESALIPKS
ncbi:hypothetical protein JMUB7504_27040 [Staphylococcus aureus]